MQKCILIVDDSPTIRKAVRKLFESNGWEVCGEAENGKDAVEIAQRVHPRLILLDLSMPVMNGLEAARVLSQVMPSVPLIMYSVNSGQFLEREAHAAGIAAVVSKSESIHALASRAGALLQ